MAASSLCARVVFLGGCAEREGDLPLLIKAPVLLV